MKYIISAQLLIVVDNKCTRIQKIKYYPIFLTSLVSRDVIVPV